MKIEIPEPETGYHRAVPRRAIKAKCHWCMGEYKDGRKDCLIQTCPLYTWMPYRKTEPNIGFARKKKMTERQKKAMEYLLAISRSNSPDGPKTRASVEISKGADFHPVTSRRAMIAKCRECTNHFIDGRKDCQVVTCSLYLWMPYRQSEPNFKWARKKSFSMDKKIPILTEKNER